MEFLYSQANKCREEEYSTLSDEDEAVANDLDMHSLILGRTQEHEVEPPSADEVIREIDFIMQVSTTTSDQHSLIQLNNGYGVKRERERL